MKDGIGLSSPLSGGEAVAGFGNHRRFLSILMLSPEYPPHSVGGLGTHVQQLARGLVRLGHAVTIAVPILRCGSSAGRPNDETTFDNGVHITFISQDFPGRPNVYELDDTEMAQLNREIARGALAARAADKFGHLDLIHIHDCRVGAEAAWELRAMRKVPVMLTMHTLSARIAELWSPAANTGRAIKIEAGACRKADRVLAVSDFVKEELQSVYGIPEDSIVTVRNGLELEEFRGTPERLLAAEQERSRLNLGTAPLVVFAGRLSPQKGVRGLLLSAARVAERCPNVRYLFLGDLSCAYFGYLKLLIKDMPSVRERVIFLPMVGRAELAVYLAMADVVAVPSVYEPFGYAALEAMAAEKPVVASRQGGLAELIEDGETGLLVPLVTMKHRNRVDVDQAALAEAQARLLSDPSLAHRIGLAAGRRAAQDFSSEAMTRKTVLAYVSLLEDAPGTRQECHPSALSEIPEQASGTFAGQQAVTATVSKIALALLWCAVLLCSCGLAKAMENTMRSTLHIEITGLRKPHGTVRLSAWNSSEAFMRSTPVAYVERKVESTAPMTLDLPNLTPGAYAIAVYQDENDNGIMDSGLFRIPTEPYGFSGKRKFLGTPSFAEASVQLHDALTIKIQLR